MFTKKNLKTIFTTIMLGFVAASVAFAVFKEKRTQTETAIKSIPSNSKHHYIAYYFHGTARCPSCLKIEKYSSEAIKTKFANELSDGKLLWKVVNIEEADNGHFVHRYSLSTKSVVLSEMNEGKEIKWKNLDQVWELLGNQAQFSAYIENEVRNFLTENK